MHSCWQIPLLLTIFEILTAVHLENSNVQININHLSSSFDARFDRALAGRLAQVYVSKCIEFRVIDQEFVTERAGKYENNVNHMLPL